MKKKTFNLVVGIVNGSATIASAVVTFAVALPLATAIVAGIGIAATAAIEICSLFAKSE